MEETVLSRPSRDFQIRTWTRIRARRPGSYSSAATSSSTVTAVPIKPPTLVVTYHGVARVRSATEHPVMAPVRPRTAEDPK